MIARSPLKCILSKLQLKPRQVKLQIGVNGSSIFESTLQLPNFRLVRKEIIKKFTVDEPMCYIGRKGERLPHLSIEMWIEGGNMHVSFVGAG